MMDKSKPTELIVLRHGETEWNKIGTQQGQLDTDLSELGIAQATAAAEALAGEEIDSLYSSDLGRAMQTAEIIAERIGLQIQTDQRLRERHLGIMQGLTMAQFAQEHPAEYAKLNGGDPDYVIGDGESIRQRYQRNIECGDDLAAANPGKRLLLVAHGGVLNSFFRRATGQDIASQRRFSLLNASMNTISIHAGQWRLERWGDTHHLGGMATTDDW